MDVTLLASLAVIHIIALVSPGPDFAIVVKMATQQSRIVALNCALGISVAILVHTLLSLLGISLMIQQSPIAYTIVQVVGISYLAWMGIGALRSAYGQLQQKLQQKRQQNQANTQPNQQTNKATFAPMSGFKGFKVGLYTNLLNPKALIFFITLFTVLISPAVNQSTKIASAVLLFTLSLIWFSLLALVLSKPRIQQKLLSASAVIDGLVGLVFVGISATIAIGLISTHL